MTEARGTYSHESLMDGADPSLDVPRSQRKLLDHHDAWAESMHKTTQGLFNVPPQALEYLKVFHAKKAFPSEIQSPPAAPGPTHPADASPPPSLEVPISGWLPTQTDRRVLSEDAVSTAEPETFGGTSLPQSASAGRTLQICPSRPVNELPTAAAAAAAATTAIAAGKPAALTGANTRKPMIRAFSSPAAESSDDTDSADEEIPVEEPVPLATSFQKPINKIARPVSTPPSALVIPCTNSKENSTEGQPPPKRRKINDKAKNSESLLTTSSASVARSESSPVQKRIQPLPRSVGRGLHRAWSAADANALAPLKAAKPQPSKETSKGHGSTFQLFKQTYPDFGGALIPFLRACLSLEWLAKNHGLPVFLYDDFVRVYVHSYIPFRTSLDDDSPCPTAIAWYNENTQRPIYLEGVIDGDVLRNIMDDHQSEVTKIKGTDTGGDSQSISQNSTEESAEVATETNPYDEDLGVPSQGANVKQAVQHAGREVSSPELRLRTPTREIGTAVGPGDNPRTDLTAPTWAPNTTRTLSPSPTSLAHVPNTSVSVLEASHSRIPETVRKPKEMRVNSPASTFRPVTSWSSMASPRSSAAAQQRRKHLATFLAGRKRQREV